MGMAESKVIELKWPWLLFFFSFFLFFPFFFLLFTGPCNALVENMFISIAMWILVFGKICGASCNLGQLKSTYLFTSLSHKCILK